MKVLDLRCAHGHGFEGWFSSEEDFLGQCQRRLVECPLCGDHEIARLPSAPRLNLSGAREPTPAAPKEVAAPATPARPVPAELQAAWVQAVRDMMARTEDVGARFAEEARRIHYGESPERGIRGQATPDERESLRDEGIEVFSLPVPRALDGPVQ